MQLLFRTRKGSRCLEWSHYALLRDNVEHYLESAPGRVTFKSLHSVERAVEGEVRYLHALDLRREVQLARAGLAGLRLADSAISLRTRALLLGQPPPFVHGTFNAKSSGWQLPVKGDEARPLCDVLAEFVDSLLFLTDIVSSLDDLRVTRVEVAQLAHR